MKSQGSPAAPKTTLAAALAALAALLALDLVLTLGNDFPGLGVVATGSLSIDALLIALAAFAVGHWRPRHSSGWLRLLTALALTGAVLHYVMVTAPAIIGRPIDLYWDMPHVPGLIHDALARVPGVRLALGSVAALIAIGAAVALFALAIARIAAAGRALSARAARRVVLAGATVAVTAAVVGATAGLRNQGWPDRLEQPLAVTGWHEASRLRAQLSADAHLADADQQLSGSPRFEGDLRGLAGADVLIVFFESYGATTFDDPAQQRALAPARAALDHAIAASGRSVLSARVGSPTFGGGSWLAHAELLSGIDMRPEAHRLLLASSRPTLVGLFERNGYRTVALMPGIRMQWPEGAFYRFDQTYNAPSLDYHGPAYGFWEIPDQFTMARVDALELQHGSQPPRMVVFATISSHFPFDAVPPLNAPAAGVASAISASSANSAEPPLPSLTADYVKSIDYTYRWLADYLSSRAASNLVTVVIGDHQPAATVSGRHASWDVPVHVIAARPELLDRFREAGFTPGLSPQPRSLGPMRTLTPLLVSAFSAAPALGAQSSVQPAVGPH